MGKVSRCENGIIKEEINGYRGNEEKLNRI